MTDAARAPGSVVVCDPNRNSGSLVAHFLGRAGYSVDTYYDGYEALDRIRLRPPTFLITESMLPRLDGLALCRLLKGDPQTRDVTVVIFSVLEMSERARIAGADAFLLKPLNEERLKSLVCSLSQRGQTESV